jgi:hypothetical protein
MTLTMMKRASVAIACALAFATLPGTAVAWNAGTHAYIAGELQKKAAPSADRGSC